VGDPWEAVFLLSASSSMATGSILAAASPAR
jgi:hypothetical protein